jgi:hypothetical protein
MPVNIAMVTKRTLNTLFAMEKHGEKFARKMPKDSQKFGLKASTFAWQLLAK